MPEFLVRARVKVEASLKPLDDSARLVCFEILETF
jgi:hypothetical protein